MLLIQDLTENVEGLTDFKDLTRNKKVNGEKTLSLTLLPTKHNEHSFHMVEEESIITFDNEEYVIKKQNERGVGNTYIKRAEAIHKFFVDMINKQQPNIQDGSMTFSAFLQFVFEDTGYTFSIIDSFTAKSFEKLGNDNRLALLQKGLERYKAEMEIIGTDVRFKNKIGNDTDFQFRYAHNIKTIEKSVDTTNLATVISGTGAEGISAYYRSPNADIFGEMDAPPVADERFTTEESLLEEMKARLEDTPEFSITIDFVDLRAAGYPFTVPNEGDRVFVIYEPMNDLIIETRIMEINEVFDANLVPIKTNITLANYKKTFAGTMFNNVNKRLRDIVNDDGIIRYNVLDEAVRIATEALKSAQTELEFVNGIIARDKTNPNFLVLLNSNGIGISRDGGNTFTEAITSEGFVLSAGAIGQLGANNIQIGAATTYESGYDPTSKETPDGALQKANGAGQSVRNDLRMTAALPTSLTMNQDGIRASTSDPSRYAQFDYRGLYVNNGAIQVRRDDGFVTIIDGKTNASFDIQGSDPPHKVDVLIQPDSRFFETTETNGNGGSCNLYTFTRIARYVVFQVAIMSSSVNESKVILVESGNEGIWLGTASAFDTNEIVQTITIDLGVPDGSVFALKMFLRSYSTTNTAYCRKIRAYQTDFI